MVAPVLLYSGCAMLPKGPVESHSVNRYAGRQDGLVSREEWRDQSFGRGIYVFTDPSLSGVAFIHTNIAALGGSSVFSAGSVVVVVDSNLVPAIAAMGTAAGNIIGAAAKTAVK